MTTKKSFAPAFDFYPERWIAGTVGMTDTEQIRYLRLLCHQWIMDGLPNASGALGRLAGGKISSSILAKFPVAKDGKRRNPMLETIRHDQTKRIESYRTRASLAAKRRWLDGMENEDNEEQEESIL